MQPAPQPQHPNQPVDPLLVPPQNPQPGVQQGPTTHQTAPLPGGDEPPRIPLFVGIFGHSEMDPDQRQLKLTQVRSIFAELQRRYPQTPLYVLTPLSTTTEALATFAAIYSDDPQKRSDVQLIVFDDGSGTAAAREQTNAQFKDDRKALQDLECRRFSARLAPIPGETPEAERVRRRRLAAAFVAHYAQILIPLLDEKSRATQQGEGEVLHFWEHGVGDLEKDLPSPTVRAPEHKDRPVWAVPTSVGKGGEQGHDNLWRETAQLKYLTVLTQIELCNGDVDRGARQPAPAKPAAPKPAPAKPSRPSVPSDADIALLPASEQANIRHLRAAYTTFDALASRFQRPDRILHWLVFLFSFIVFVLWRAAYGVQINWHSPTQLIFVAASGLSLFMLGWAWWYSYGHRHYSYRILAEELRILLFWRLAGESGMTRELVAEIGRKPPPWVLEALSNFSLLNERQDPLSPVCQPAQMRQIDEYWVGSQKDYFQGKLGLYRSALFVAWVLVALLGALGLVWISASFLLTQFYPQVHLSHMVAEWLGLQEPWAGYFRDYASGVALMAFCVAPFFGEMYKGWNLAVQLRQYEQTLEAFKAYSKWREDNKQASTERVREEYQKMARCAIQEIRLWGDRHRDQFSFFTVWLYWVAGVCKCRAWWNRE